MMYTIICKQLILALTSARFKGFALKAEIVRCGEMQCSDLDIHSLSLNNLIFTVARYHLLKQQKINFL